MAYQKLSAFLLILELGISESKITLTFFLTTSLLLMLNNLINRRLKVKSNEHGWFYLADNNLDRTTVLLFLLHGGNLYKVTTNICVSKGYKSQNVR